MDFIKSQLTKIPQITLRNLSNSTVLITGANTGLGLEAAREILHCKPKRLILAVRNLEKGRLASKALDLSKPPTTQIDVQKLDQASFESIHNFVKGLKGERVDIAILNAGVWNTEFIPSADGYESDLQVNTLGPALLSLLLLPNLRLASTSPALPDAPRPHLTIVSSGLHGMAKFPERRLGKGQVLSALNDPKKYHQQDRYPVTKALGLLWTKALAERVASSEVIINAPTPGFCKTGLMRNTHGVMAYVVKFSGALLGRSAEDGARCLVSAAIEAGPETHGKYLSETHIKAESELVGGEEGKELQGRMWQEIVGLLKSHGLSEEIIPQSGPSSLVSG